MKKTLCAIFIAMAILVSAVAVYTIVDNRTLKNTLSYFPEIDIFVPSGMANEYENLVSFTFDDHRIWKYKLNSKESEEMNEELKNSHWSEFTDNEKQEAVLYFPGEHRFDSFSEETYYCLYSTVDGKFVSFNGPGVPRFLFIYDVPDQEYCCVSLTF